MNVKKNSPSSILKKPRDYSYVISGVDLCVDYADRTTKVLKVKKDVTNIPMTNPLVIKMAKKAMDKQNKV